MSPVDLVLLTSLITLVHLHYYINTSISVAIIGLCFSVSDNTDMLTSHTHTHTLQSSHALALLPFIPFITDRMYLCVCVFKCASPSNQNTSLSRQHHRIRNRSI